MIYTTMDRMDWTLCAMLWATLICTLPYISIFDVFRPSWEKDEDDDAWEAAPMWLRLLRSVLFILAIGATAHMVSTKIVCS